jgi:hypothetical protein
MLMDDLLQERLATLSKYENDELIREEDDAEDGIQKPPSSTRGYRK